MKKLLLLLKTTMPVPEPFGTLHLIAIAVVVALSFCLCYFFRDSEEKTYRTVLLVIWIIMIVMESVKQLVQSYSISAEGEILWRYHWSSFPLQLCDAPLYLLPFVVFMKEGKLRKAFSLFLATYLVVGGLTTYLMMSVTFTYNIYLNASTLTHHGLQIVSGILIAAHDRRSVSLRSFPRAICVFLVDVAMATAYNVGVQPLLPDETINMFYISPYHRRTLPTFINDAWQRLDSTVVIVLYILVVTLLAFLVFSVYLLCFRLSRVRAAKGGAAENNRGNT